MKTRRNLSGIYVKNGRENVCFEDLTNEEQMNWMDGLDADGLKRLSIVLANTLNKIGDQLDIVAK